MEGMERRAREDDDMNKYERTPIGEGQQEQVRLECCRQEYRCTLAEFVATQGV